MADDGIARSRRGPEEPDDPDVESAEATSTDDAADGADDDAAGVDHPGLGELREAATNYTLAHLPRPPNIRRDGAAALSVAITNVPDGLANGVLVGVNPIFGLYAAMVGPLVGGWLASTRLMVVSTTAAVSLTAGRALAPIPAAERESALFLMVVLAGMIQIAAGMLHLGRLTRFVSYSVTKGFLTGVALLLILSQLPTISGYDAEGPNRIAQTLDLVAHVRAFDPASLAVGAVTLTLAVVLPRTKMGFTGRLAAIAVPSILLVVLGWEEVRTVRDVGRITQGLPVPGLPSLVNLLDVLTGAFAVALVSLVQGTGVSQSVPNPDGSRTRISRDFIAQGSANLVSGFFHGLPVGGSVSTTALNVLSGASTRWAAIFAGLGMAVIVLGASGLIAYVATPALGALLVLAGASAINPRELRSVWYGGWPAWLAGSTTFFATLFLPIQAAVGIGVVLSAMLYVTGSSTDVTVVRLVELPDGRIEERDPPRELPADEITLLDVYGPLFYAGARTLERRLPSPRSANHSVVILRLRGRTTVGATLVDVITHYADDLKRTGGKLYLTGIGSNVHRQLRQMMERHLSGPVRIYEATTVRGESTQKALADAEAWLVNGRDDSSDDSSDAS